MTNQEKERYLKKAEDFLWQKHNQKNPEYFELERAYVSCRDDDGYGSPDWEMLKRFFDEKEK